MLYPAELPGLALKITNNVRGILQILVYLANLHLDLRYKLHALSCSYYVLNKVSPV